MRAIIKVYFGIPVDGEGGARAVLKLMEDTARAVYNAYDLKPMREAGYRIGPNNPASRCLDVVAELQALLPPENEKDNMEIEDMETRLARMLKESRAENERLRTALDEAHEFIRAVSGLVTTHGLAQEVTELRAKIRKALEAPCS